MRGWGDEGMRNSTASGGRSFPRPFVFPHPLISASPHLRYEVAPAAISLRASLSGSIRTSTLSSKIMFAGVAAE